MNKNIDLTKILKDCPKETELYSPMYGKVYFNCTFYSGEDGIIYCYKTRLREGCARPINSQCTDIVVFYNNGTTGNLDFNITPECMLFPSKEQRNWSKFSAPWYKKEKFDPKTLQPFDKVLVRIFRTEKWRCEHFSYFTEGYDQPYMTSTAYPYCVPYNDDTKHLVGTKDEAPEFYRYWED